MATAREGDRLSKRMTAMGLASRREADDWIAAGWVRVDGKLAVLGQRIGPDARIDAERLQPFYDSYTPVPAP